MTDRQILQKAINKAIGRGWDLFGWKKDKLFNNWEVLTDPYHREYKQPVLLVWLDDPECGDMDPILYTYSVSDIVFNHDFAKAFWFLDKKKNPYFRNGGSWQFHLQQMVLEENPIKYLEKFL